MFLRSPEGNPRAQTLENIWKLKLKHFFNFVKCLNFQMFLRSPEGPPQGSDPGKDLNFKKFKKFKEVSKVLNFLNFQMF